MQIKTALHFKAIVPHGISVAFKPVPVEGNPFLTGQMADAPIARLDEMGDCLIGCPVVVHHDLAGWQLLHHAVKLNHGNALPEDCGKMIKSGSFRRDGDEQPGHPVGDKGLGVENLAGQGLVALADHYGIAVLVGYLLDAADDRGKKVVPDFRHYDAYGVAAFLLQRLGELVGLIIVFLGGCQDPLLGSNADVRMIPQGAGHGGHRDAQLLCNILERVLGHGDQPSSLLFMQDSINSFPGLRTRSGSVEPWPKRPSMNMAYALNRSLGTKT